MKKENMPHCQTDADASEIPFTAAASVLFFMRTAWQPVLFSGSKDIFLEGAEVHFI